MNKSSLQNEETEKEILAEYQLAKKETRSYQFKFGIFLLSFAFILVGFLVNLTLSIEIQQVLVVLIGLLIVVSLDFFRKASDNSNSPSFTLNQNYITSNSSIVNHYYAPEKNLVEAATEIQQLLNHLSQNNETQSEGGKLTVVAEAVEEIESNPKLKSRITEALRTGGKEAMRNLISHPAANILLAAIEGWNETEG